MDDVKVKNYIQEYFNKKFNSFTDSSLISSGVLEREAISKILGKRIEEVTDIEISLLLHLYYTGTMSEYGNNMTDTDYKNKIQNVYKHLADGLSLEKALDLSWKDPNSDKLLREKRDDISLISTGLLDFKSKYPTLFDQDGNLKDSSYELFDLLMKRFLPELQGVNKKEDQQNNIK